MDKKIQKIVLKFFLKEANIEELRQLEIWINNPNNEKVFYDYVKLNSSINMSDNLCDLSVAKKTIVKRIRQGKRSSISMIKYNAVAILIIWQWLIFLKIIYSIP